MTRTRGRRFVLAAALLPLLCAMSTVRADFSFPSFPSAAGVSLIEAATLASGTLRLTPALADQKGACWFDTAQALDDGFQTTFAFSMSNPGGADGMAFVIQTEGPLAIGCPGGNPCGSSPMHFGSKLGYEGIVSVAIELDAYSNVAEEGDFSDNHISVHTMGMAPNDADENLASIGSATPTVNLNSGAMHTAIVEYQPGTLRVFLNGQVTPLLTVSLDLAATLGSGPKWVGFTGATGGLNQLHVVHSWSLQLVSNEPDFRRGECNGDGSINLPDAVFLLSCLFPPQGTPPVLPCLDACDTNDDGGLNLVDAIALLNALFGQPVIPLPPPAACGADPTPTDALDCLVTSCP